MQAPNINATDGTIYELFEGGTVGKYGRPLLIQEPFFVVDAGFLEYFSDFTSYTNSLLHRICRGAQDRAFFKDPFLDLAMLYSQGRRLTRKPLGGSLLQLSSLSQWFTPDRVTLYRHISHLSRSARSC